MRNPFDVAPYIDGKRTYKDLAGRTKVPSVLDIKEYTAYVACLILMPFCWFFGTLVDTANPIRR